MSDSSNGSYTAPYAVLTPADHGGLLVIAVIATLAITVLSVGLRIHTVYCNQPHAFYFHKDDVSCFAAAVFYLVECILVWISVDKGNGEAIDLVSSQNLDHLQRIQYAVDIFYIAVLFCSRASVIFLLQRLQGLGMKPIWTWSLALLSSWFIASVFAVALKCNLSYPWIQYNVQCTGLLSRWQSIEISGIVTDCAIFGLAVYLVSVGRMAPSAQRKILFLFATRFVVIIFAALRIVHLSEYLYSTNPTYSGVATAICALAEASASIATTTTPLLKAFILKFQYNGIALKPPPVSRLTQSNSTGPRKESNFSDDEKPDATSCFGEA